MQNANFVVQEIHMPTELQFPVACYDTCFSRDGQRILAVGVYKPTVKLFDLQLGMMKFERHIICDPIRILSLEDDAEKFSLLRSDKTVEFHAKGGLHEKIRMPNQPKDMLHNAATAELYLGGTYNEIYRFNLEQGRFLKSIGATGYRMAWSNLHGFLGAIYKKKLTFTDTRMRTEIFRSLHDNELLSIAQDESGLRYALGNENGEVLEYDFRSSKPLRKIQFDSFLSNIKFLKKSLVAVTASKVHFIQENDTCADDTSSIDVGFQITNFSTDDGLIMVGGENPYPKVYASEQLGSIPGWALLQK